VNGREWRSCVSSTHTFLAKRESLLEVRNVFLTFGGRINHDLAMWMALTKLRVFNPFKAFQWMLANRKFWVGSIVFAWWYFWRQILFGRRYTLWIPKPAIATHMMAGMESPGIDWPKNFEAQAVEKES
jgi:hypothetical protein